MANKDRRQTEVVHRKELLAALDPFARVMIINELMPSEFKASTQDEESLRDLLPGSWPTVGDLRRLYAFALKHGWTLK